MDGARVLTGSVEEITVYAVNRQNQPLTGLTDVYLRVRRKSDGFFLDWNDDTFKAAGWTTLNQLLSEDDATNGQGLYSTTLDLSAVTNPAADDVYTLIISQTGTSMVIPPPVDLREGDYVDDIPAILADTDSLDTTKLTTARANNLDNLDMPVGFQDGIVYVDSVNGVASTVFPAGTVHTPTNTMERAKTIATAQGLRSIHLHGTGTLASSFADFNIEGDGALHDTLNLANQSIDGTLIQNLTVQGTIGAGTAKFVECIFNGITNFRGEAYLCAFQGTTEIQPGTHILADCFSNVAGSIAPIFDLQGVGEHNVSVRRWSGGFDLRNVIDNGLDDVSLDVNQGNVLIAANCVGGTIVVRGDCNLSDNSSGSTVIDNRTSTLSADAVWDESTAAHVAVGSFGLVVQGGGLTAEDIADAVWDEALSGHAIVGSTGAALSTAAAGADPSAIADAVWDTLRADHTGVGTMGEAQTEIYDHAIAVTPTTIRDAILSDGQAFEGARIQNYLDAAVSTRTAPGDPVDLIAGALDSNALDVTAVAEIADGVWDEAMTAHVVADSAALYLKNLDALVSSRAAAGDAMALVANAINASAVATSGAEEIAFAVWEDDIGAHLPVIGSAAEYIERLDADVSSRAAPGALMGLTVAARGLLVDETWDEPIAGHLAAGSTGLALNNASATGDPAVFAAAVWDLPIAGHTAPGTTGQLQGRLDATISSRAQSGDAMDLVANALDATALAPSAVTEIQAAILSDATPFQGARIDAAITSRAAPGAAMDLVANALDSTSLDATAAQEIADQVWDELIAGHLGAGSTGEALNNVAAPATPAAIAAAVWTEALPGAYGAGSAGYVLGTNLDALVTSRAAPGDAMDLVVDALDTASLAASAVTEIQASILSDATPFQGARIDAAISSRAAPGAAMDLITNALDANAIDPSGSSELAEAFLDEALAGHTGVGTVGERINRLDATITSRAAPGADMGLTVAGGLVAADAVWDESLAAHQAPGSTGEGLTNASATTNPTVIADAVWDALRIDHQDPGSMGEAQQDLGTLLTQIQKIDQAAVDSPPTPGSLVDILTNKDGGQTYDQNTDSLEALKDRIG